MKRRGRWSIVNVYEIVTCIAISIVIVSESMNVMWSCCTTTRRCSRRCWTFLVLLPYLRSERCRGFPRWTARCADAVRQRGGAGIEAAGCGGGNTAILLLCLVKGFDPATCTASFLLTVVYTMRRCCTTTRRCRRRTCWMWLRRREMTRSSRHASSCKTTATTSTFSTCKVHKFFLHDAVEHHGHGHATCVAVPCLTAAHAPTVRAASMCMPLRLLLDATPLVGAGNTYATRLKWLMACGSVILFPVDKEYFHQAGIGSSLHGAPHLTLGLP